MKDYTMPKMDHLTEENMISEWKVKEGDAVQNGDVILVVETGKNVLEVQANFTGKIMEILLREMEIVPVGTVIARYEEWIVR